MSNPTPPPFHALAAAIRNARQARRWSQAQLGQALGVKRATVSLWEQGQPVSPLNLAALRALFGHELVEPAPPPSEASLAFWRGRVVQIAHHLRAVLAEQDTLAADMAGAYAPDEAAAIAAVTRSAAAHDPPADGTAPRRRRRAP